MSFLGNVASTALQAGFGSTVNSFTNNIIRSVPAAGFGSFALNNFNTVSEIIRDTINDVMYRKTLANFRVNKKINRDVASGEQFLNVINNSDGYIRPNRYLVEFNAPNGLRDFITKTKVGRNGNDILETDYDLTKIGLLCHSVSIPQKSLQTYEHKQLSVAYKVPHSITFDPITFTFYCDGNMDVRRFFDAWMKVIIDDDNAALNFYDDFIADIKISLLDIEGKARYIIRLSEAYPLNLSSIDLAYASNNNILSVSVTLSYKKWNEIYED